LPSPLRLVVPAGSAELKKIGAGRDNLKVWNKRSFAGFYRKVRQKA